MTTENDKNDPPAELSQTVEPVEMQVARYNNRVTLIVAVLGMLLSAIVSVGGIYVSQQLQDENAQNQLENSNRAKVYTDFLSDANGYQLATDDLTNWLNEHNDGSTAASLITTPDFTDKFNHWLDTRSAFQGQVNNVYVYGSSAAWESASQLAGTLPPATGPIKIQAVAYRAYDADYLDFLDVMCHELDARPGSQCE